MICETDILTPGEAATAAYLEQHLPDDWLVIVGRELVHPSGSVREVDFIVVGHHLVYAVEEKGWRGRLFGNDRAWVLSSGESRRSPLNQASTIARPLAGLLRYGVPGVKQSLGHAHFVYAAVVLSAAKVDLRVHDPRCAEHVWKLRGCEDAFARREERAQQERISIHQHRGAIVKQLTVLPHRPKIPARINAYAIEESLGATGPIRAYLARHEDGSRHVLKLLPKPESFSTEVVEEEKRALLREYNTLRKLQGTDVAPTCDPYFYWQDDQVLVVPISMFTGNTLRASRTLHPPRPDDAPRVMTAAFESLARLHDVGVVHRSLSPDRVWLCDDSRVRFSDFVVSRLPNVQTISELADDIDPPDPYRAPECRVDPGLASAASDIYSLSAALLLWLTGQEPNDEGQLPDWLAPTRDALGKPHQKLVDLLRRCLAEDDRKRPTAEKAAKMIR